MQNNKDKLFIRGKIKKVSLVIALSVLILLSSLVCVNAVEDTMTTYVNVTSTRTLSILYVPIDKMVSSYENKVNDNHEFIQKTYPLRDNGIDKNISFEVYNTNNVDLSTDAKACDFLRKFNEKMWLTENKEHRVIGITSDAWFGERGMSSNTRGYTCFKEVPAAILSAEGFRQNTAHEVGHTYGLCDEYNLNVWGNQSEDYGCPNGDEDSNNQLDNNCLSSTTGCPITTDKKVVPFLSGEGDVNLRNFMGGSYTQNERWISKDSYNHLIYEFTHPAPLIKANKVMLVSGIIYDNDTVEIDPIYWLENITLYNETLEGNYTIIINENQNVYYSNNFTADFFFYNIGGNSTLLNESGFLFFLPATDNTTSITISKNGVQLKEVNVSPNTPQISVGSINGTSWLTKPFNLTWNASDLDNDNLFYAILISSDNGSNYTSLEIDSNNTFYEINPSNFDYSEQYLFKVLVTDGINTAYDFSNTFTMGVKQPVLSINVKTENNTYTNNELVRLMYQEVTNPIYFNITTFNNSLSAENLTFTGSQNIIRYLRLPKTANVTKATLNISGYGVQE